MIKTKYRATPIVCLLFVSFLFVAITPSKTYAEQNIAEPGVGCGNPNADHIFSFVATPIRGNLYIKLRNSLGIESVSVYSQNLSNGQCSLIGQTTANSKTWVLLNSSVDLNNDYDIIIQASSLYSPIYVAAAYLLNVPSNSVCVPTVNCVTKYQGYNATIVPTLTSGESFQLNIYGVKSIQNVGYKEVNYFSNNHFLYSSRTLLPVNHNYLSGGIQNTQTQVSLADNQQLQINAEINMGPDWTGTLYIRSRLYRDKAAILFFAYVGIIIAFVLVLLNLVRLKVRKYMWKRQHGLTNYSWHEVHPDKPGEEKNKIIVG